MELHERAGMSCGKDSDYWSFITQHMPECVASAGAMNGQVNKGNPWVICMDVPMTHGNTAAIGMTGHGKNAQFWASLSILPVESGRNSWLLAAHNRNVAATPEVRHVL
ncbi:MAG: hypothetical protein G3W58_22485 [Pantoea ananatis]|nr:hypothetical protein [Pantoea ananatis]